MNKLFLLISILLSQIVSAQKVYDQSTEAIEKRIKKDIYILASDSFGGREAGTKFESIAANYIANEFKIIGLKSVMYDSSFFQSFVYSSSKSAINVLGLIDNGAKSTVIIGGHYDHLGMGKEGSRYSGPPLIHHGADDNASGTAGMIELARYLSNSGIKTTNFLFIAFSAEEKGLIGSWYFVQNKAMKNLNIKYMLDLDMIGRMNSKNKLIVECVGSSPIWDTLLTNTNNKKLRLKKLKPDFGGSDQNSFIEKRIPSLFFITGLHADYHTPYDTPDKVNYQGEVEIIQFIEKLITKLDKTTTIPFTNSKKTIRQIIKMAIAYKN
ncbi:MAG: M20/M25/M40 family metallo-hydrolase [Bacteroidetes bacterium]|nr:M20/M25/M40 family metallo-hydrolase [Bacteroidota bacterium]